MFQTPTRYDLVIQDAIGFVGFGLLAILFFSVWIYIHRQGNKDRWPFFFAGMCAFISLRLASGVQIRLITLLDINETYDKIWIWTAYIIGLGLNMSIIPVLWSYLGDSVRGKINAAILRILKPNGR